MEGNKIAQIEVRENENLDAALRRFKKKVENEGVLKEYRERQYFKKASQLSHEHDRALEHKAKRKKVQDEKKQFAHRSNKNKKRR